MISSPGLRIKREYVWKINFKGGVYHAIAEDEDMARMNFKRVLPGKRLRGIKCAGIIVEK